ncbi:Dfp1/Him1, central region-domain-containing protein [Cristinia sonorae]|uniref:Dfp1/Him1, central region-domain-containing protein n=1 Tax=Cristinia sonorae TaxID=1940300 RepID=A0A8K0UEZ8_9AGAR|nr:Dfp1/Him1, central region-domain-containing protein [Cristinia sonorae]
MTTLLRSPLTVRSPSLHNPPQFSPILHKTSSIKRARSPEPTHDSHAHGTKRVKAVDPSATASTLTKEEAKKKKDREKLEKENEFRYKYTKAFPKFNFYFDFDDGNASEQEELKVRVAQMGATVDHFFSQSITHLVTDQPEQSYTNKENTGRSKSSLLQSPIKLKGRFLKDTAPESGAELVKKAIAFQIKIWSPSKLESVLDRCQNPGTRHTASTASAQPSAAVKERSLSRLLESERLHGTTERDPTQKRHDYVYFSKNSYFVLVEDMKQELATIAVLEYPIKKDRDGKEKGSWPVLYCHPLAKGPFLAYDPKKEEERRKQKAAAEAADKNGQQRAKQREEDRKKRAQLQAKQGDLRRVVSMSNLHRRATFPCPEPREELIDLDADFDYDGEDSAAASGFRESGQYVAASGNSVGITSTAGTTSTLGGRLRTLQLPVALTRRIQQEVVTSRRLSNVPVNNKENTMGPPPVPERATKPLRKSKSTNTLRLPKREEGTKPGYCESCRQKFDDFKTHITGRRHRKFATDDANFVNLDYILSRVRRRTLEEVEADKRRWRSAVSGSTADLPKDEPNDVKLEPRDMLIADDFSWDEWMTEEVKKEEEE